MFFYISIKRRNRPFNQKRIAIPVFEAISRGGWGQQLFEATTLLYIQRGSGGNELLSRIGYY
jgi:hypothetical protein